MVASEATKADISEAMDTMMEEVSLDTRVDAVLSSALWSRTCRKVL